MMNLENQDYDATSSMLSSCEAPFDCDRRAFAEIIASSVLLTTDDDESSGSSITSENSNSSATNQQIKLL